MDLLEHQGKQLLRSAGFCVPPGRVADSVEEAVAAGEALGWPVVIKAQVPVGGRGKAGAIAMASDASGAVGAAEAVMAAVVSGHRARRVLVESAVDVRQEWYAAVTFDRAQGRPVALLSAGGGVDVEAAARAASGSVARCDLDPRVGLNPASAASLVAAAGLGVHVAALEPVMVALADLYLRADAELVEINPLVLLGDGRVMALDAKVTLDDSAAFRHPEWAEWADGASGDSRDQRARASGVNYVGLAGSVGVIGNGAGLVMSTLDVIAAAGGSAANFCDIGGGASAAVMSAALEVVTADPQVRSVLVNVFGGITRGEEVAAGIIAAVESVGGGVDQFPPLVVRLDGTNATDGLAMLAARDLRHVHPVSTMTGAAQMAVDLARSS
ncbi:MAG: ADP-forming succinate--CoA ligase subunit beta [Acidimicrobiales bacterium]